MGFDKSAMKPWPENFMVDSSVFLIEYRPVVKFYVTYLSKVIFVVRISYKKEATFFSANTTGQLFLHYRYIDQLCLFLFVTLRYLGNAFYSFEKSKS